MSKKSKVQDAPVEITTTPEEQPVVATVVEAPAPAAKPDILRKSAVDHPVAKVWLACDSVTITARANGTEKPRRKDVVDALVANGVAWHTARTQYQAWSKATDKGRLVLNAMDPKDLPRSVRDALVALI